VGFDWRAGGLNRSRRRGALAETKALAEKGAKKPRKASSGQKEMLMPIAGKKASKEAAAKKPAARAHRKSA
jgi:DNA end-binding protein Ku